MNQGRLNFNKSERGFVLVLLPLLVLALLCGLGLVVDSANMYAAQVKAGAAAEQGVLSAIGSLISESDPQVRQALGGPGGTALEQGYLRPRFENSAQNNLFNNGIERKGGTGKLTTKLVNILSSDVQFTPANDGNFTTSVTGIVRLEVPVFFRPVYSLLSNNTSSESNVVSGFATAELRGSVFVFIIDTSSSQSCPSIGPCICKTHRWATVGTCRNEANQTNGRIRIEDIRQATQNVLTGLDPRRDRVAIVIYNNSAQVLFPFGPANQPGFNLANAITALDRIRAEDMAAGIPNAIIPNGNTNISDAIITGQSELAKSDFLTDPTLLGRINMILLSDGAPTAMRVIPDSNQLRNQANTEGQDPDGHQIPRGDYISMQLSLENPPGMLLNFPGPFVKTLEYKKLVDVDSAGRPQKSPMVPRSINASSGYDDAMLPDCHRPGGGNADPRLFSTTTTDRVDAFSSCLPNGNWKTTGPMDGFNSGHFNIGPSMPQPESMDNPPTINDPQDFRQMYYLAAVQAVERLAPFQVRFFTLSWGPDDTEDRNRLFNVNSVSNVKKEVLANLANDPYSSNYNNDPNSPDYHDKWADPTFQNMFGDQNRGFRGKASRGIPNGGTYVAIDAAGLNRLFANIIQAAKLAVVSVLPTSSGDGQSTYSGGGGSGGKGSSGGGHGPGEGEGGGDKKPPKH